MWTCPFIFMKKVQIIGLPGSGKTTYIQQYLRNTNLDVAFLDIRNFAGTYRDRLFRQAILQHSGNLIAESACGVRRAGLVIQIDTPIQQVYAQLLKRDKQFDEEYLSLLGTQMVTADYTLEMPEDLPGLLKTIFKG